MVAATYPWEQRGRGLGWWYVYLRVVPGADEKGEVDGGGTPEAGNDSISLFQDRGGVCGERGCHSWM
ncbi:hypothetical protein B296_00045356 [Ensete ventricosum]|uniref:Uncharacterized protein n=1 Tax=Ensete ventricosum TaxID=4639 RepID=A0A426XBN9_ENSVE|nr:hypothetical protein B296_00045356 [Ensete ventricosum]